MDLMKAPSGVYHIRYVDRDGKRRKVSTKTRNRQEALKVAKAANIDEIESAARVGRISAEVFDKAILGRKGLSLSEARDEWDTWLKQSGTESELTRSNYVGRVDRWLNEMHIADLKCSQLKGEHIADWINGDDKGSFSNRKFLRACVMNFTGFLSDRGYIIGNPGKLAKVTKGNLSHEQKEKKEILLFDDKEVSRLLSLAHPDGMKNKDSFWFCAIILARYAGLRLGDICQLKQESLAKPGYLTIWTDKRETRVEIPIAHPKLKEAILWLPYTETYFWPTRAAEAVDPKARSKTSVQFKRLCEKLDIFGRTFHGLRHTFANECLKKGVQYPHISALMGHMLESTTRRHYLKEAIKSL